MHRKIDWNSQQTRKLVHRCLNVYEIKQENADVKKVNKNIDIEYDYL